MMVSILQRALIPLRLECYALLYCESGQLFQCHFKWFKEGIEERRLFLEQNQNIFVFSAYTDTCTLSCKIVVVSKSEFVGLQ